tara:strand:- start:217 stop:528 length:312 start_codon:yes stop_codon:yes gene_type:complete
MKVRDIEIKVEKYSWGILRVIQVGSSKSIVIHPEDASEIAKLKPNERLKFTEETGQTVIVTRGDEWEASMNRAPRSPYLSFTKDHLGPNMVSITVKISALKLG